MQWLYSVVVLQCGWQVFRSVIITECPPAAGAGAAAAAGALLYIS